MTSTFRVITKLYNVLLDSTGKPKTFTELPLKIYSERCWHFFFTRTPGVIFDKVDSAELEHTVTSVDLKFIQSFTVQKLGGEGGGEFELMCGALLKLQ